MPVISHRREPSSVHSSLIHRWPRLLHAVLIALVLCSLTFACSAQCVTFTTKLKSDTVGNIVSIPVRISSSDTVGGTTSLRMRLVLGNASMLYPVGWRGEGSDTVDKGSIVREASGVFTIRRSFTIPPGATDLTTRLDAIATAGNDSVCTVIISNIVNDSATCGYDTLLLRLRNLNHPSTYVRLLTVGATVPLPCQGCARLRWQYHSDKDDVIRAEIFDVTGRAIDSFSSPITAGDGDVWYDPSVGFLYNGVYIIRFRSATGTAVQWFILAD